MGSAPTGGFIQASDGTSLAIRDWGKGKPLVFLSAWCCSSDMWSYQMTPLSQRGFRRIAYDRRGHGRSSAPGDGYDLDTLANDLATVLSSLDLHGVTLVGHSSASGEIVRYLTAHGGSRIDRLLFSAPGWPYPTKSADNPDGLPAEALELFRQKIILRDFPKWLDEGKQSFFVAETSLAMQDWFKGMMLTTSMQAAIGFNRAISAADLRPEMARINLPTLVVHGDKDASNPIGCGRAVAQLIPGARLSIYPGAPHGLFITHLDRYNSELADFANA
jgi:pimeloyl-ACP methyl ester carboxylesterase